MKYDTTEIPATYDRARARSPEVLARWMDEVCAHVHTSVSTILDLGCGTGRFSGSLRDRFDARVIGLDPSTKMIRQARLKPEAPKIQYVIGQGEDLPLEDQSVDLVFMSMVFHHLTEPGRVARECHRVLTPDGVAFLRAGTVERIPSYPPARFFPESVPIMERVLSTVASTCAAFESAGFRTAKVGTLEQQIAPDHSAYAEQVAAGGDSVLVQLGSEALAAGLGALRSYAATIDPRPVTEPIDYFVFDKAG